MSQSPAYTLAPNGRLVDQGADAAARSYATFVHAAPLIAHFLGTSVVGISLVIAAVMWRVRRESFFLDDHGRETVNFQISLLLYWLIAAALSAILIGLPLLVCVYALGVVGSIRGAMFAHRGEFYRYPMCLRLVQ